MNGIHKTQYFHLYKRGILIGSIIYLATQLLIYVLLVFFSWTIEKQLLHYLFRAWASDASEARRKIRHRFLFPQNCQEQYDDLLHQIETNQDRLELEFRKRRSWDGSQSARTCSRFQQGDQDAQFWGAGIFCLHQTEIFVSAESQLTFNWRSWGKDDGENGLEGP